MQLQLMYSHVRLQTICIVLYSSHYASVVLFELCVVYMAAELYCYIIMFRLLRKSFFSFYYYIKCTF